MSAYGETIPYGARAVLQAIVMPGERVREGRLADGNIASMVQMAQCLPRERYTSITIGVDAGVVEAKPDGLLWLKDIDAIYSRADFPRG